MKKFMVMILVMTVGLMAQSKIDVSQSDTTVYAGTVCLDGYKFAIVRTGSGVSITQVFDKQKYNADNPQPIRCSGK